MYMNINQNQNQISVWETPAFPVTICDPGEAYHSDYLNKGVTVRPKQGMPVLFHGVGMPRWRVKGAHSSVWLWAQELWVFCLEMTPYLRAQLLLDAVEAQAKKDIEKYGHEVVVSTEIIRHDSKSLNIKPIRCKPIFLHGMFIKG